MTTMRKLIRATINALGDDEVEVVMSTASLARDGHILLPQGCLLENYRANPIVLWSHDTDKPVGNAENVVVSADQITARVRFAPLGISAKADEIRGLTKANVIRAVSIAFDPLDGEPLDSKKPRGGQRFTSWELLEMSFVSVPSDTGAVVTARAQGESTMTEEIAQPPVQRANRVRVAGKLTLKRGLYQVAQLCYLFQELGWQVDMAAWEAACEGDDSKVPGMLAAIFHDLGDAVIAMTQEEIAEALAGCDVEPYDPADDDVLIVEERTHIAAATSDTARAFRRGLAHAKLRAGKTLSAETVRCLRDAQDAIDDGATQHRSGIKKAREAKDAIGDLLERSGVSDPDDDTTQTVQTSDGTGASEGSANGRSADAGFRRRQADKLKLRGVH